MSPITAPAPMIPLARFCADFAMSRSEFYRREATGEVRAIRRGARVFVSAEEYLRQYAIQTRTDLDDATT